jgi:hypothetical protein
MKDYTIHWRRSEHGHWSIKIYYKGVYDFGYYSEHNEQYVKDVLNAIKNRLKEISTIKTGWGIEA